MQAEDFSLNKNDHLEIVFHMVHMVPPSGPVPNRTLRWKQGKVYIASITFQSMLLK
jgi:hypothetical protein